MALNSVYRKYFQKSQVFLYPLLGIKRGAAFVPKASYIAWENNGITSEDMKLICVYVNEDTNAFNVFVKSVLLKHSRLFGYIKTDNNTSVFTFDFSDLGESWNMFMKGKYSKISLNLKNKILNYFDQQGGNYHYMNSYLFPEKYFSNYAELLETDVDLLKSVGELCPVPDLSKESLMLEIADLENINSTSVNL